MQTTKKERKQSLPLALLLSFAVSVVGACLFGLIYYTGFISVWVAFLSGAVAFMVYNIFHKTNWLSFVWVMLWTIILDEVALILASGIAISGELSCSVGEAIDALFQLVGSDSEVKGAFLRDTILSAVFAVLGVGCYFVSLKLKEKKEKEAMAQTEIYTESSAVKTQESMENKAESASNTAKDACIEKSYDGDFYNNNFKAVIKGVIEATKCENKQEYADKLKQVYNMYIATASSYELEYFEKKIKTMRSKPDISAEQTKVLDIFSEKLLKNKI